MTTLAESRILSADSKLRTTLQQKQRGKVTTSRLKMVFHLNSLEGRGFTLTQP